ncbi:uncharacterized protein LOC114935254 [Nylanderia fulva]|uniref:uncharacterized protein LOC114935254 n=1 Tax=Nylanderia fulva TaxID=613905 RepID=UPI0010FB0CD3|nr:uncharacterized protein LOC114935254 [Nylanderia fulva]
MKMWNPRKSDVRLIFLVTFVIFLCHTSVTDSAAVHHKMSDKEIEDLKLRLQNFTFPWRYYIEKGNVRLPRDTNKETEKKYCYTIPCGWAVYNSYTRNVEYYMKNTCECLNKDYKCVRSGDDLSASAYVYRCRQNMTAGDLEFPVTDEDVN